MDPTLTYAVVVGIEKYQLTSSDLKGPGEDAVQFVEWLRGNNVPAKNIFLFLSPLSDKEEDFESRLNAVGVSYKAAGRIEIEGCLEDLRDRQRFTGDLLYLFWGGHGIADESGKRYLFYADTTDDTLYHHLDVPTRLGRLASYVHLPKQIGYFDTCANLKPEWKLGASEVTVPPRNAVQLIFFAAAIGQRAANNSLERSGKFSLVLREVLAKIQSQSGTWPPDPHHVIELLRERFRTDRTQKPAFYEAGDFNGDRVIDGELPASEFVESVARRSGYAARDIRNWAERAAKLKKLAGQDTRDEVLRWLEKQAGEPHGTWGPIKMDEVDDWSQTFALAIKCELLDSLQKRLVQIHAFSAPLAEEIGVARDLNQLDQLIEMLELKSGDVQKAYRLTVEQLASPRQSLQNRRDMLRELKLSANDGLRNLAEFVLRLYGYTKEESLREWVQTRVQQAAIKQSTVAEIETKLQTEIQDQTHYLLFWIKDSQVTSVLFRGKTFDFVKKWARESVPVGSLDKWIDERVREAEVINQNLFVQFLVGSKDFKWSPQAILLEQVLEGVPSRPLGSVYFTVMRWRERVLRHPRTEPKKWEQRAEEVLSKAKQCRCLSWTWIAEDTTGQDLMDSLKKIGAEHQILAFDFSAPQKLISPRGRAIIDGIPVILWPSHEVCDSAAMRLAISTHIEQSDMTNVFDKVKSFYATYGGTNEVTLFWDDPKDQPEKWEYVDDF